MSQETRNGDGVRGERRRLARIVEWIVIALAVALAVLAVFFVREYLSLRRAELLRARQSLEAVLTAHGPLTANDVSIVQEWMTFDYLNKVFGLPVNYLKTALPVTSAYYPQLSIGDYARNARISQTTALANVRTAITHYFGSASSSAAGNGVQ